MDLVAPGDEPKFLRILNEAESRLQESARWNWTKTEIPLDVVDGHVYLDPALYASLLGVMINKSGRVVRPRDIEFAPNQGYRTTAGDGGLGYLVDCGIAVVEEVRRRKYKIVDMTSATTTAEGLVHLAHVELSGDEDLLACPSARALKLAMFACVIEEANDLDRANVFWSQAYSALNDDEAAKRGGIRGVAPIQPFGDGVSPIGAIM